MERKQAKFSVRLPDELNKYINESAADMGMSKNGFILFLIQMWKQDREKNQATSMRGFQQFHDKNEQKKEKKY